MTSLSVPVFTAPILVAGDVMLDCYWQGQSCRLSPEAPVPIVDVAERSEKPGGAANVALNLAALGHSVSLCGYVGQDEAAQQLTVMLEAANIDCTLRAWVDVPTITKVRVLGQNQQMIRLDFERSFAELQAPEWWQTVVDKLPAYKALVLSDYGKGTLAGSLPALIQAARQADVPVFIDPKGADFERYRGATMVTPNLKEFEAVVGSIRHAQDLQDKGQRLLQQLELQALLVTQGSAGMTLLMATGEMHHFKAKTLAVFDVTGAGDTVVAVLAGAVAAGQSLAQAAELANLAAGISVKKLGASSVSVPELRRAVQRQSSQSLVGILDCDTMILTAEDARAHGERIVMTNGCFDILHPGHIEYLEAARRLGDRLIVAVNDDASVRRLKGAPRPFNPLADRMRLLSALRAVDWVVPFAEDTPEALIRKIRPNVLVKGGDYQVANIVGGAFVQQYGGEVRVLNFVEGYSTTGLVEKLQV